MDNDIYEELDLKEINREKKVRKKKHYFLRFLIFIGIIAGLGVFAASSFFDVDSISVEGSSYYSEKEVITMSKGKTGGNIFWGSGISAIKDRLESNPYFEEVKVSRKLPNKLVIVIKERRQTAAVVYGDEFVVIDSGGTVLRKADVDPKITLLTGLTISKMEVGEKIKVKESETLDTTLKMLEAMTDGDLFFKKIDVSNVIIKAYFLDTLLVKGTPKQVNRVIENGDLKKVVNNLLKNDTERGTINIGDHNYMSFSPGF